VVKLLKISKHDLVGFFTVIFTAAIWFALSSEVLAWIDNLETVSIGSLLSLISMSLRAGGMAAPIVAMALAAISLFVIFGLVHGKVHRFIALHLGLFTIAMLIGASISVAVYFYLFEDIHILFPAPSYIFTAFNMSQVNNNSEFFFACFIGFGITGIAYFAYFAKEFLSFGKELGKARFANALEIHKAGLFEKNREHKGFVLAKTMHGKLYYNDFEPIVVVSGTGGGKSTSLVTPNMLELINENIIVTDIKGNIYQKTHKFREAIGNKVYKVEPGSKDTHRYNPLGLVRKTHLDEDLDSIFKTLIPDSSDNIWADESRNIAKALALYEFLGANSPI
jgi:type IV secretory pathway TraG/TraD family ATPase VirD4